LTRLEISRNAISGTVPTSLFNLTNLRILSLWFNPISGTLPPLIGRLSRLQQLRVGTCRFSGTLPSELALLSEMTDFHVVENNFTGSIDVIRSFPMLTSLRMEGQAGRGFGDVNLSRYSTLPDCHGSYGSKDPSCFINNGCPINCCPNGFRPCASPAPSTTMTPRPSMTMRMSESSAMTTMTLPSMTMPVTFPNMTLPNMTMPASDFGAVATPTPPSSNSTNLIIGVSVGVALAVFLAMVIVLVLFMRPRRNSNSMEPGSIGPAPVMQVDDDDARSCQTDNSHASATDNYGVLPTQHTALANYDFGNIGQSK
jgi:hypothetical protein